MIECDNVSKCHDLVNINDVDAMRVICKECKHQYVIRKELVKDVPEKREYARIFKRDILQGKDNLFYKYYSQNLVV